MTKVKLNVKERLTLMQILPENGNLVTMKALFEARMKIALSEKEVEKYEVKQEGRRTTWSKKGEKAVEIEVGEIMIAVIKKKLKEMDEKEELTLDHIDLFEKFNELGK